MNKLLPLLLIGVSLAGCTSTSIEKPINESPQIAEPIMPATEQTSSPDVDFVSPIPKVNAEQEANLLREIESINPAFINRKTIDNARNQCHSMLGGGDEEKLLTSAKIRFTGLGVKEVSDSEAVRLLEVIRTNGFCVEP